LICIYMLRKSEIPISRYGLVRYHITRLTPSYPEKMLHWTSLSAPAPALLLLPLAFALAIVPPLENPALLAENGLPLANASELQYDLPLTNLNASPQCDGAQYGRNLRSASCDEVLELVHPSSNDAVVEYGQRGHYAGINKLPVRWLSCML